MTTQEKPTSRWLFPISPIHGTGLRLPSAALASTLTLFFATHVYGAFTPAAPATCPAITRLAFNFTVGYGDHPWDEVAVDPATYSTYINNVINNRYFLANAWSTYAAFAFANFSTEPVYDYLAFLSNNTEIARASGTYSPGSFWTMPVASNVSTVLRFVTDYSVSLPGFQMNEVDLCTNRTSPMNDSGIRIANQRRSMGLLLGTDDVVYAYMTPAGSADTHASFYLWGTPQPGEYADFDLYVRCGQKPTYATYTAASRSSTNNEFIDVTCGSGQWFYVAVQSYSGRGSFNLVASTHYASQHKTLTAGANFVPTADQWQTWTTTLTRGVRRFYGMTEGAVIIDKITLFKNGTNCETECNGPCNFCLRNDFSGADALVCIANGRVNWGLDYIDLPQSVAHELGHLLYCNWDEYTYPKGASCGHTLMDAERGYVHNVCVNLDHNRDKIPPRTIDAANGPGQREAFSSGITPYYVNETADNTPFYDFRFFQEGVGKEYFYAAE